MRAPALIVVSSAVAVLGACSLFSLGGLTGGAAGTDSGGDAPGDVTVDGTADAALDTAPGDAANDSSQAHDMGTTGDAGTDAPALPPYRVVFVSSLTYTGDLGGAAGADAKCQLLAQPHFAGQFMAWLSDGATTAAARMTPESVPYQLADGTVVASDWSVLVNGTLAHAVNEDETGSIVSSDPSQTCCDNTGCYAGTYTWTDTDMTGGVWDGGSCNDWTTTTAGLVPVGGVGNAQDTNRWWTAWCYSTPCSTLARLYCVQQ